MRRSLLAFVLVLGTLVAPAAAGAGETSGGEENGAVYGTVIDAVTERPVDGICVWVTKDGAETDHHAVTSKDGVYEIGGMLPGEYVLEFVDCEREAYATVESDATVTAGEAAVVNQYLALRAGVGSIVGTVLDAETRQPVAGVCAKLFHADDDIYITSALTGQDGGYQLYGEAGEYRVWFKPCESGTYYDQWYNGAEGWDGSTAVTIAAGSYTDGIDADMVPDPNAESVVWGYVKDGSTGEGVHGYCVSLYIGEERVKTVLTGEAGGYEMVVDPDDYRIKTWACEGHVDLGTVWFLDGVDFATADVVEIPSGVEKQLDTIVVGDVRFHDAIDSMFLEDIVWLAEQGITLGCNTEKTEFCPDEHVTRAQMAAFLHRALADVLEGGEVDVHFDDVPETSTFKEDIEWLASVGVTLGCNAEGTMFCPDEKVSRAQMAAFLHRALKDILVGEGEKEFSDDDGSTFEKDIEWLASVGVTEGCDAEGTEFCPDEKVIRAHMAAFLHRALGTES